MAPHINLSRSNIKGLIEGGQTEDIFQAAEADHHNIGPNLYELRQRQESQFYPTRRVSVLSEMPEMIAVSTELIQRLY